MKKVMAILIAMLMVFSLFACSNQPATASPDTETSTPPASTEPSAPATTTDDTAAPSTDKIEIGRFDPSVDYTKNERYKIAYMYSGTSFLYQLFDVAFKAWADRMNVEYIGYSAPDSDQFLTTIQTYIDQGYDGLIVDPDSTIYPALVDIMADSNMPWMGGMSMALDPDGNLMHPFVGFLDYGFGYDMFKWCIDYAKENWKDSTPENTGGIFIGYSTNPQLDSRAKGSLDSWNDGGYLESNYFFGDGVTGDFTSQTAYTLASTYMAANPDIKYWIACGFYDDYTMGCVSAARDAGKAETTVCSTAGGSTLFAQWDEGETSSWKHAVYTDQRLYAEPIFCGLYAMVTGQATAETLWPEWVDHSKGYKYATLLLPSVSMTHDMYKEYMAFVDKFTGIIQYDKYGITNPGTYPVSQDPPASFNG